MNRRNADLRVPEGLPALARGRHRNPRSGACLMEYVSVLAGRRRQTDRPSCTHPVLAALARQVNDRIVDDTERARLALLAPRLIGTDTEDHRLAPMVTLVCLKAAASAGAGGPDFQYRVWRARTSLRRGARNHGGARRFGEELELDGALRVAWRQIRSLPVAERDHWLADLLEEAVDHVHRLLCELPTTASGPASVPEPRSAGEVVVRAG